MRHKIIMGVLTFMLFVVTTPCVAVVSSDVVNGLSVHRSARIEAKRLALCASNYGAQALNYFASDYKGIGYSTGFFSQGEVRGLDVVRGNSRALFLLSERRRNVKVTFIDLGRGTKGTCIREYEDISKPQKEQYLFDVTGFNIASKAVTKDGFLFFSAVKPGSEAEVGGILAGAPLYQIDAYDTRYKGLGEIKYYVKTTLETSPNPVIKVTFADDSGNRKTIEIHLQKNVD